MDEAIKPGAATDKRFTPTRWSLVLSAGQGSSEALNELCLEYWRPAYGFLRRAGLPSHDAQDVVQMFLANIATDGSLARVSKDHGKFRTWLLKSLGHQLSHWREREAAQKRGGKIEHVTIGPGGWSEVEAAYEADPGHELSPDRLFDRSYATQLVSGVVRQVEADYRRMGKGDLFQCLVPYLTRSEVRGAYEGISNELGMEQGALRGATLRLRAAFMEMLRRKVAETLPDGEDVKEEVRYMLAAWFVTGAPEASKDFS